MQAYDRIKGFLLRLYPDLFDLSFKIIVRSYLALALYCRLRQGKILAPWTVLSAPAGLSLKKIQKIITNSKSKQSQKRLVMPQALIYCQVTWLRLHINVLVLQRLHTNPYKHWPIVVLLNFSLNPLITQK